MSIDGLHGKPNSTRLILYRNHYNEKGLLCWTEGIEEHCGTVIWHNGIRTSLSLFGMRKGYGELSPI